VPSSSTRSSKDVAAPEASHLQFFALAEGVSKNPDMNPLLEPYRPFQQSQFPAAS
jgi:hypothetical protein